MGKNAKDKDPRFQAWYGNLQATMRSLQRIDRDVEAATGVPLASVELLVNIAFEDDGRIRMGELADNLLLSRGGATRLVARLGRPAWFTGRSRPTTAGRPTR